MIITRLGNFAQLCAISILAPHVIMIAYPSVILGVYGADLHKVLVDVLPNLWGQPHLFRAHMALADKTMGAIALTTLLLYALRGKVRWRVWVGSIPVMSQVTLGILFVVIFLSYDWDSWSLWRLLGFLGGNLFLLIMGAAVCHGTIHLRRIWSVWLVMSTVLGLGGVWLLSLGLTWGSARNALINLSNIRLGYVCALAIIFLTATYKRKQGWKRSLLRFLGLIIFGTGVVTSGSKASLLFLVLTVLIFGVLSGYLRGMRVPRVVSSVMSLVVVLIGILTYVHYSGSLELKWIVGAEAYEKGIASRVYLGKYYLEKAFSSPVFGIGFSEAWSLGHGMYPHNVLIELFVQAGAVGLALFLSFVVATLSTGWRALRCSRGDDELHRLIAATLFAFVFTLMMVLTRGDMVSNRVCWLFAGMLLGVGERYKKHWVPSPRTHGVATI